MYAYYIIPAFPLPNITPELELVDIHADASLYLTFKLRITVLINEIRLGAACDLHKSSTSLLLTVMRRTLISTSH